MDGIGPIDPDLAPDLARAAATNPKTTWCVTVTDEQGHARRPRMRPTRTYEPRPHHATPQTRPARWTRPARGTRSTGRHPKPTLHLRRLRPARPARRIRTLAADHGRPRPPGPDGHPRSDRPGHLRPPLPGPRSRPRRQAPAPVPDPPRHMHRPALPPSLHPGRLRAQHPVRKWWQNVPV